ncbi:MAG: HEAT repeat domain-containing protein [bacterium]
MSASDNTLNDILKMRESLCGKVKGMERTLSSLQERREHINLDSTSFRRRKNGIVRKQGHAGKEMETMEKSPSMMMMGVLGCAWATGRAARAVKLGASITKKTTTLGIREASGLAKTAVHRVIGTAVKDYRNDPEILEKGIEVSQQRSEALQIGMEEKAEETTHQFDEEHKKMQKAVAHPMKEMEEENGEKRTTPDHNETGGDEETQKGKCVEAAMVHRVAGERNNKGQKPDAGKQEMSSVERLVLENALRDMKDSNTEIRETAAREMWRLGKIAVPCLSEQVLNDSDQGVRIAAIASLGTIRDDAVIPLLDKAMDDPSPAVRKAALRMLYKISDQASTESLLKALMNKDQEVRRRAIRYLSWGRVREAIPRLAIMLRNGDEQIKKEAIAALGDIGDKRAVPYLISALSDSDVEVMEEMGRALNRLTHRKVEFPANGCAEKIREYVLEWENWWRINQEEGTGQ